MSDATHRMLLTDQHWVDRLSTWCADRCSPILVKEARQAMKSWHFQWTFLALLLAVVAWSFLGISITLFDGQEESGGMLMSGYMFILGFPLGVVLPLASFRSLAREFDDETIQLLSITTLSARRIVLGKLGSAALQMVVYLSAVVPCVAFSYLLRGTDLTQIAVLLLIAVIGSLSLCCLGLMLAGFARFNWLAIMLNLALMALVGWGYFMWCMFNAEFVRFGSSPGTLSGAIVFWAIFGGTGYVAFECATSLISFPSEDRSSRIRMAISLQVFLVVAAFSALIYSVDENGFPFQFDFFVSGFSTCIAHYYCLIGAMMVSEQSGLSQRVRRGLPRTFVGRMFRGLYVPGPGRGYLFALSAIVCWNLGIFLLLETGWLGTERQNFGLPTVTWMFGYDDYLPLLVNGYFATLYLSFIYLFMLCFGRLIRYGRALAGALLVVVAYAGVAIACTTIDAFLFWDRSYSWDWGGVAQHWNWPYVLSRITRFPGDYLLTVLIGSILASALALICCCFALREWVVAPTMVPQRVEEESKLRSLPMPAPTDG
jgi:ABC-type transport system involved in multi-copper enzyme maturation permease subunit